MSLPTDEAAMNVVDHCHQADEQARSLGMLGNHL
jgi:hypothetical protein